MTTMDMELEAWRREWRTQTEPLPALKRKIRLQNLRTIAAVATIGVLLVLSTVEALRTRNSFVEGLATGLWLASLTLGGYVWWVRRGAWKPAAQTTLAYLQLTYKRAVARARSLRFSFYFLLTATVLYGVFVAWNWRTFSAREAGILAAMALELFLLRRYARRNQQAIEQTRKLLEQTSE